MPAPQQPGSQNSLASPATGHDSRSLRERIERRLWRTWKPLRHQFGHELPRSYVFVAGMQRSGTNMLMEMLEWSRWTDVYHEFDNRAFDNYEMRPRGVIRSLATNSTAPFFVIKSLCELEQVRSLMDEFKPAKTLWLLRGYDDGVNSAIRSFGNFASQVRRLARDKSAADWRGRGMSDDTQHLLRQLAHPAMGEASAAALMWYYRNVLFFEQGLDRDPRVKLMRYEDLVGDPAEVMRETFEFLGVPNWSPWISRYVHVKSVGKSPRADIEPAVRELCQSLRDRFDALDGFAIRNSAKAAV